MSRLSDARLGGMGLRTRMGWMAALSATGLLPAASAALADTRCISSVRRRVNGTRGLVTVFAPTTISTSGGAHRLSVKGLKAGAHTLSSGSSRWCARQCSPPPQVSPGRRR